jgi:hypothetical protein
VTFGSVVNLTEGVGNLDPAGSYQKHGNCVCNIDLADINARGATDVEDIALLRHAYGFCLSSCAGLGSRTDSAASNYVSRRAVAPILPNDYLSHAYTPGQECIMSTATFTSNGDFSLDFGNCSAD